MRKQIIFPFINITYPRILFYYWTWYRPWFTVKILLVSVSFKNKRFITNMRLKRMLYNQLPSSQRLSKTTREVCTNISVFASWLWCILKFQFLPICMSLRWGIKPYNTSLKISKILYMGFRWFPMVQMVRAPCS